MTGKPNEHALKALITRDSKNGDFTKVNLAHLIRFPNQSKLLLILFVR